VGARMKFRLLTALWGAEFCDIFLRVTARSLLAAGNFPDLSRRHDATYTIITTAADAARIAPHPVFRALAAAGKVELQTIDEGEIDPTNPSSHWIIWRKGIEAAKEKRESVIYIMPDVVYASGTLLGWASAFEQGYRAVFSSVPEVVLETTLRELDERPAVAQRAELNLSVRELTSLFLKHIHTTCACCVAAAVGSRILNLLVMLCATEVLCSGSWARTRSASIRSFSSSMMPMYPWITWTGLRSCLAPRSAWSHS
jgi:hypothetical protein